MNWDLQTQPLCSFKTTQAQPLDWIRGLTLGFHPMISSDWFPWTRKTPPKLQGKWMGGALKRSGHNWLLKRVASKKKIRYQAPKVAVNSNEVSIVLVTPAMLFVSNVVFKWAYGNRNVSNSGTGTAPHEEWGPPVASIQQTDSLFDGRTSLFWCDAYIASFSYNPDTKSYYY